MFLEFLHKHHITDKKLAVGVSGGADSLALVLQMQEELVPHGYEIVALTVNHGLRPESLEEAEYVADLMKKFGIGHHILTWEGDKPQSGIEEAARIVRYNLLKAKCLEYNIRSLFIAHHQQDQAETFLMRLQRGSGVDGLCGMAEVSTNGELNILRPFLNCRREEMKIYLQAKGVHWVEDSSNESEEYLRVRVRHFLPLLEEKLGITPRRIVDTMEVLARTRSYFEEQTAKFIKNHVKFWDKAGVSVAVKILKDLHPEMLYRVLNRLLKKIGGRPYTAESEEILRLSERLFKADFKSCTLADCEILASAGKIWIIPEAKEKTVIPKKVWEDFTDLHPQYKKIKIPYKLRLSLLKRHPI